MEGPLLSSSQGTQLGAEVKDEYPNASTGGLFEDFQHEWYIRVKAEKENSQHTELARNIERLESNIFTLSEGKLSNLIYRQR